MIPAGELAAMRAELERTMPDTCDILSVIRTSDGAGGMTETWGTASSSVACRMDMLSGDEAMSAGAMQPFGRYILTLPTGASITTADRVLHNDLTYNVLAVNVDISWMACKRAILEVVR